MKTIFDLSKIATIGLVLVLVTACGEDKANAESEVQNGTKNTNTLLNKKKSKEMVFLSANFDNREGYTTKFSVDGCTAKWITPWKDSLHFPLSEISLTVAVEYGIPAMTFKCQTGKCIKDTRYGSMTSEQKMASWFSIRKVRSLEDSFHKLMKLCGGTHQNTSSYVEKYPNSKNIDNGQTTSSWKVTSSFYVGNVRTSNISCGNGSTNQVNYFPDSQQYGVRRKLFGTMAEAAEEGCK